MMPNLQRYFQQVAPSGRVGQQEVNPEALTKAGVSGEGLPWRGVEAAGRAVAGTADVFQQAQDIQDETDLSTADRLSGEYMAGIWRDIEKEPDYKKHEQLYTEAISKLPEFAPKSPRAARLYGLRINQSAPAWKAKLQSVSLRRMNWTIERDNQANIDMSMKNMRQALENGDTDTAEMANFNVHASADTLVKSGLIAAGDAAKIKEDADYEFKRSNLWYGAMELMRDGQMDKATEAIMSSDLLESDKIQSVHMLNYHDSVYKTGKDQQLKLLQEQHQQAIFAAIQDGNWDALPEMIRNSSLTADDKYSWEQRVFARAESVSTGKPDPFLQHDPATYASLLEQAWKDPDSMTMADLTYHLGRGTDNGINLVQFKELSGMITDSKKAERNPLSPFAARYITELGKLNTDGILFEDSGIKTRGEQSVLFGQMVDAIDRWVKANPKGTPDQLNAFYEELTRAPKEKKVGQVIDRIRTMEHIRTEEQRARRNQFILNQPLRDPQDVDELNFQLQTMFTDKDKAYEWNKKFKHLRTNPAEPQTSDPAMERLKSTVGASTTTKSSSPSGKAVQRK